uniref:Uncharacterized protein n=1 Tax=Rhipicephalus microplus TaxID=6941 RepID=A0A6G5AF86_RHIMP
MFLFNAKFNTVTLRSTDLSCRDAQCISRLHTLSYCTAVFDCFMPLLLVRHKYLVIPKILLSVHKACTYYHCLACYMVHFVSLLFACLFLYKTVPASAFIKHTGAMCLSQQCELVAFTVSLPAA